MFRFKLSPFLMSLSIFVLLAYIAIYIKDQFIRPFLGDVLVVIWLFYFLYSIFNLKSQITAHIVLFISFSIEIAQYFKLIYLLNIEHIQIIKIILGSTFDWYDLLAYTIGWLVVLLIIKKRSYE